MLGLSKLHTYIFMYTKMQMNHLVVHDERSWQFMFVFSAKATVTVKTSAIWHSILLVRELRLLLLSLYWLRLLLSCSWARSVWWKNAVSSDIQTTWLVV
jgi:hypothetical protein